MLDTSANRVDRARRTHRAFNRRWHDYTGYDVAGNGACERQLEAAVHPADLQRVRAALTGDGKGLPVEFRLRRNDGGFANRPSAFYARERKATVDHDTRASAPGRTIELDGEWDLARKAELTRLFGAISKDGPLTIDLQRVTFADSTFLSALAVLAKRLQGGGPITLFGANDRLRRVLTITNLDRFFRMVDAE